MNNLQELVAFADVLAGAARDVIRVATRTPFEVIKKGDGSPVTVVDRKVEDTLRVLIEDKYPDHGILGEERAPTNAQAEFKWVIDPIDGTIPFLAGIPVFGTLIALVQHDAPFIGIIEMPMTQQRWLGVTGTPTTCNGVPVQTRKCEDLSHAVMTTSNPDFYSEQDRPALDRMHQATRWSAYGGSCMAYAQLATGRVDVSFDVQFDIHDYLALVPVIKGAGGVITDWAGEDLTIHSKDKFVAAGDLRVHRQALAVLNGN